MHGGLDKSISKGLSFIILFSEMSTRISAILGTMIIYNITYIFNINFQGSNIIGCLVKKTFTCFTMDDTKSTINGNTFIYLYLRR